MSTLRILIILLASACGAGSGGEPGVDATDTGVLPTWQLEDIQPLSTRTGQTYGLDAFSDHVVVVTLVQGF